MPVRQAGGRRVLGGTLLVLGAIATVVGVLGILGVIGGDNEPSIGGDRSRERRNERDSTVTTTRPASAETPPEFFARLTEAVRAQDVDFSYGRLHPYVLERYGESACRSFLAGLASPGFEVAVLSVGAQGPWDWTTDALTRPVADALTVRLRSTRDGTRFAESEGHVVVDDGRILWFTDCGTPIAGGR